MAAASLLGPDLDLDLTQLRSEAHRPAVRPEKQSSSVDVYMDCAQECTEYAVHGLHLREFCKSGYPDWMFVLPDNPAGFTAQATLLCPASACLFALADSTAKPNIGESSALRSALLYFGAGASWFV